MELFVVVLNELNPELNKYKQSGSKLPDIVTARIEFKNSPHNRAAIIVPL